MSDDEDDDDEDGFFAVSKAEAAAMKAYIDAQAAKGLGPDGKPVGRSKVHKIPVMEPVKKFVATIGCAHFF